MEQGHHQTKGQGQLALQGHKGQRVPLVVQVQQKLKGNLFQ